MWIDGRFIDGTLTHEAEPDTGDGADKGNGGETPTGPTEGE